MNRKGQVLAPETAIGGEGGENSPHSRVTALALFFPVGKLETTPTVKHLATALARNGFAVDLYTLHNLNFPFPVSDEPKVRIIVSPQVERKTREPVPSVTMRFFRWVRSKAPRSYAAYVASGIRGLFVATLLGWMRRRPVIYHCIELYPSWNFRSFSWRIYKQVERWCTRRAARIIIQDQLRAGLLARDNDVPLSKMVMFPVSTFGPARDARSRFLHQRVGIAEGKRLILCAGGIFDTHMPGMELVMAAQDWPEDWVLVMHSSAAGIPKERMDQFRAANIRGKVVLSLDPVPYEQLPDLVSSADAGLAIYNVIDDNIRFMGLSSGKLAEYAVCGVPIVVSDLPGIGDLVRKYQCGVAVQNPSEVAAALRTIFADYGGYRQRVLDFFAAELDLCRHGSALAKAVAEVIEHR